MEEIQAKFNQMKKATHKLRVSLFFGYNGKNYRGLQFHDQQGIETVEKSVFQALIDGGFILSQHMGDVKNVSWTRGARTDKGVHALVNTVSLKMNIDEQKFINPPTQEQLDLYKDQEERALNQQNQKQKNKKLQQLQSMKSNDRLKNIDFKKIKNVINSHLPNDIKLFSVKPVTAGFNVRHAARSRKYEYYMPLRVFQSYDNYKENKQYTEEEEQQILEKIQKVIDVYKGTKNYHNFTIKIRAKDPEAVRYMIELKANIVQNEQKTEKWVRFQLHGASFMYHQIRKMIGMVAMLFQKDLPIQFCENAFFQNHVPIWLAPAEGLFLNRITFDGYNKKGDVPVPLILDEEDEKEVEKFRVYLQDDVILNSSAVFDDFITHFMELSDEQIDEEQQKEKESKQNDEIENE